MTTLFLTSGATNMSNIISFLLVLIVGAGGVYMYRQSHGEEGLEGLFTENLPAKANMLALYSTMTECVGLTILATLRGVDLFNAVSRYSIMAFLEIACTYIVIQSSAGLQKIIIDRVFADNKLEFKEIAWVLPYAAVVIPLLIAMSFPTWIIAQLYYESTGALRLVFDGLAFWPWNQIRIYETGQHSFVELGAFVIIWATPIISVIQIVVSPVFLIKKKWNELQEALEEEDDDIEFTFGEEEEEEKLPLYLVVPDLSKILNHSEQKITTRIDEVLGFTNENSKTHPDIVSGSKTPEEVAKALEKAILGDSDINDPSGIFGYWALGKEATKLKTLARTKLVHEINTRQTKIKNGGLTAVEEQKLQDEIDKLQDDKDETLSKAADYSDLQSDVLNMLEQTCRDSGLYP